MCGFVYAESLCCVEELIGELVHAYSCFWKDAALSGRVCCMDNPRGKSGINC